MDDKRNPHLWEALEFEPIDMWKGYEFWSAQIEADWADREGVESKPGLELQLVSGEADDELPF